MGSSYSGADDHRPRPGGGRRRKRTISTMSTTEVLDEMERFSRRTISICQQNEFSGKVF